MTNVQKIRAMSDEELAGKFGGVCLCSYIQDNHFEWCNERAVCTDCVSDWLKQPVKEDA